jgi:hypothetical protein
VVAHLGAEGYWLYQRDATAGQAFQKSALQIPADSWVEGWVVTGHRYEFYVVPTRGWTGQQSDIASAVADPQTAPGPVDVVATPDVRSAHLSWQRPTGPRTVTISKYNVYYKDEQSSDNVAQIATTTDTSIVLKGLIPGHEYAIGISSVNAAGEGMPSPSRVRIPR